MLLLKCSLLFLLGFAHQILIYCALFFILAELYKLLLIYLATAKLNWRLENKDDEIRR
jgi:hypothetical protein